MEIRLPKGSEERFKVLLASLRCSLFLKPPLEGIRPSALQGGSRAEPLAAEAVLIEYQTERGDKKLQQHKSATSCIKTASVTAAIKTLQRLKMLNQLLMKEIHKW